ncbi:MAG: DUF1772 domain-containing protein [Ginsengibacter sp.]
MTLRKNLFIFFLWWAVIGISIFIGGTIFSMSVVVPMWSESPPESVKEFFGGTSFNKHIYNFFGVPWAPLRNLPVFFALLLGWYSKSHRLYLLITVISIIFSLVFTVAYIYPINDILMTQAGGNKSSEEIQVLVNKWIFSDRLRFAVVFVGYFFLLKAFRIPISQQKISKSNIRETKMDEIRLSEDLV